MDDKTSQKQQEYRDYINEHISNVKKAFHEFIGNDECINIFTEMVKGYGLAIDMVYENIQHHDESKFSDEEFEPYRKEFYSISEDEKEKNKKAFDKAWKHHYMNNYHHWDIWDLKKAEMPSIYIVEMICDWQAMGYKFGDNALNWYNKEKDNIKLQPNTRKYVEKLLNALCK